MNEERTPSAPPCSEAEFLSMSDEDVCALVAPRRIGMSLLVNGTRRLFLVTKLDVPPRDLGYLPAYLDYIHRTLAELLRLLMSHGISRVFLPVYSADQHERDARAHHYLVEGIRLLTTHPALVRAYEEQSIAVRFYGSTDELPGPARQYVRSVDFGDGGEPQGMVHYGIDGGDPYCHVLRLAYEFGTKHGRAPSREELVALYYGEQDIGRLDILVAFNRTYARLGIPPCLDGQDRIYTTAISPLVLTTSMLRRILYDYLFRNQDRGRTYLDLSKSQYERLHSFYEQNRETIIGLTEQFEGLCFPCPSIHWPHGMIDEVAPRKRES